MLFVIGLGLGDEKDITVKGLEAVQSCTKIYLEAYTSILCVGKEKLVEKKTIELELIVKESYYGKKIILADRELVESGAHEIIESSKKENVAFLVVGDPFGATTHTDLVLRAKEMKAEVKVIHNASIMNAVGACGLQLYNFGQTVSIVFFEENWKPDSFYDKILANKKIGLHTLCLLDIKMKEQTVENLLKGNKIYEPPRFLTINRCIEQMLEIEQKRQINVYDKGTLAIGMARVGQDTQKIVAGTLGELLEVDFGAPLHCLVIPGEMHILEKEFVDSYRIKH